MTADDIVARLIAHPPRRLSELEAIIGPIGMSFSDDAAENMGYVMRPRRAGGDDFSPQMPWLSIRYAFDIYHEDPRRPRDVTLLDYRLHVRGDRGAVEAVLANRFGTPRRVVDGTLEYAAYHPFYIASGGAGDFILAWHSKPPRWTIPVPDLAARTAWLSALRDRIATARTVDEIAAFCRDGAAAAGVEVVGTLNSRLNRYADFTFPLDDARDFHLTIEPPVRAQLLAEIFGWHPAVGYSGDVHMSSWSLMRRDDAWYPISGALDHWELHAHLTEWPSGAEVERRGACTPRLVGDDDEVDALSIAPRFK